MLVFRNRSSSSNHQNTIPMFGVHHLEKHPNHVLGAISVEHDRQRNRLPLAATIHLLMCCDITMFLQQHGLLQRQLASSGVLAVVDIWLVQTLVLATPKLYIQRSIITYTNTRLWYDMRVYRSDGLPYVQCYGVAKQDVCLYQLYKRVKMTCFATTDSSSQEGG